MLCMLRTLCMYDLYVMYVCYVCMYVNYVCMYVCNVCNVCVRMYVCMIICMYVGAVGLQRSACMYVIHVLSTVCV